MLCWQAHQAMADHGWTHHLMGSAIITQALCFARIAKTLQSTWLNLAQVGVLDIYYCFLHFKVEYTSTGPNGENSGAQISNQGEYFIPSNSSKPAKPGQNGRPITKFDPSSEKRRIQRKEFAASKIRHQKKRTTTRYLREVRKRQCGK